MYEIQPTVLLTYCQELAQIRNTVTTLSSLGDLIYLLLRPVFMMARLLDHWGCGTNLHNHNNAK